MNTTIEVEAETTDEAIEAALAELGVGRDQVVVEIVEEPNKGLLGLRKAKAKVRVTVLDVEGAARATVEGLLEHLGVEAAVSTYREDEELWVVLEGESLSWLIGHHGQTLDAIQTLVQSIIGGRLKTAARVIVDVEGYRSRRKKEVKAVAERTIGKVLAGREALSLRPMNAYERKLVHIVAGEYDGVTSISTGIDPDRFVIITPVEEKP